MQKTTVLLINLGTPDSPSTKDVRRYLFEFLNDKRVIDLPWLLRKFLVNCIIVPFRAPKSAKLYKQLWTEQGSPLMIHGERLKEALQVELGTEYKVELAMRYQNPSMDSVLEKIRQDAPDKLIVLPLYPQYASSTTGSTLDKLMKIVRKWEVIPELKFISKFQDDEGFINAFAKNAEKYDLEKYDHVVFSYHGLPIRHLEKIHPGEDCTNCICQKNYEKKQDPYCYQWACYQTTDLLAKKLNLSKEKYSVGFQSRLDKNWMSPFTDKLLLERAAKGDRRILMFCPAFVADCLETTIEIADEYQELFLEAGGEQLDLVESLNAHPHWVQAVKDLVLKRG